MECNHPHCRCMNLKGNCPYLHYADCLNMAENKKKPLTPEALAVMFHDAYEFLAPSYGYETRPETKVFDSESKNGKLMIATAQLILSLMKDYTIK